MALHCIALQRPLRVTSMGYPNFVSCYTAAIRHISFLLCSEVCCIHLPGTSSILQGSLPLLDPIPGHLHKLPDSAQQLPLILSRLRLSTRLL